MNTIQSPAVYATLLLLTTMTTIFSAQKSLIKTPQEKNDSSTLNARAEQISRSVAPTKNPLENVYRRLSLPDSADYNHHLQIAVDHYNKTGNRELLENIVKRGYKSSRSKRLVSLMPSLLRTSVFIVLVLNSNKQMRTLKGLGSLCGISLIAHAIFKAPELFFPQS
jgi:hypothetical protein